jgi:hypothetical protein
MKLSLFFIVFFSFFFVHSVSANDSFCTQAYTEEEKIDTCTTSYNKCILGGGSHSRCFCKAIGGISLNTNVPFVGNCISMRKVGTGGAMEVTPDTAFPLLMA